MLFWKLIKQITELEKRNLDLDYKALSIIEKAKKVLLSNINIDFKIKHENFYSENISKFMKGGASKIAPPSPRTFRDNKKKPLCSYRVKNSY